MSRRATKLESTTHAFAYAVDVSVPRDPTWSEAASTVAVKTRELPCFAEGLFAVRLQAHEQRLLAHLHVRAQSPGDLEDAIGAFKGEWAAYRHGGGWYSGAPADEAARLRARFASAMTQMTVSGRQRARSRPSVTNTIIADCADGRGAPRHWPRAC